jgi:sporulation protein YlmC with PRC-barrel domain
MKIKDFIGKKVYDSEAKTIGKITDVDFDPESFAISSIEVGQGIVKKVSIGIDSIAKVGDSVFLKVSQEMIGRRENSD